MQYFCVASSSHLGKWLPSWIVRWLTGFIKRALPKEFVWANFMFLSRNERLLQLSAQLMWYHQVSSYQQHIQISYFKISTDMSDSISHAFEKFQHNLDEVRCQTKMMKGNYFCAFVLGFYKSTWFYKSVHWFTENRAARLILNTDNHGGVRYNYDIQPRPSDQRGRDMWPTCPTAHLAPVSPAFVIFKTCARFLNPRYLIWPLSARWADTPGG